MTDFSMVFAQPIQLFPILADSFAVELLAVELLNCWASNCEHSQHL